VQGKVNNITLDGCRKVGLLFASVVSSCEAVNCASLQLQCTGACPTLAIDKTDGVQVRKGRGGHRPLSHLFPFLEPFPPNRCT